MKLPLLFTVGEWLQENALPIVIAVIGWFITSMGTAAGLLWKVSQAVSASEATGKEVKSLAIRFEHHMVEMDEHIKDLDMHTTSEQRHAINAQLVDLNSFVKGLASKEDLKELKSDIRDWMLKR